MGLKGARCGMCERRQNSHERVTNDLSESSGARELAPALFAAVSGGGCVGRLASREVRVTTVGAGVRHHPPSEVWQRSLRHQGSHHRSIQRDAVDDDARKCVVNARLRVVGTFEGVDVDPLLLTATARPKERRIRAPNLDASLVRRLRQFKPLPCRLEPPLQSVSELRLQSGNGVPNRDHRVAEGSATPCAEVASMRVDAEPVLVQMRVPAFSANNPLHRVPKHAAGHEVDCLKLGDFQPFASSLSGEDHAAERPVDFLPPAGFSPSMNVDASVQWERGCVIDRRDCSPTRDAARVAIQVEGQSLFGGDGRLVSVAALGRLDPVFRCCVRLVHEAPKARTAIAPPSNCDDVALSPRWS
jgi:hypothetical protein